MPREITLFHFTVIVVQYYERYCRIRCNTTINTSVLRQLLTRFNASSNRYCLHFCGDTRRCSRRMCKSCARNGAECLVWFFLYSGDGAVLLLRNCTFVAYGDFCLAIEIFTVLYRPISVLYRLCRSYPRRVICAVYYEILVLAIRNFVNSET